MSLIKHKYQKRITYRDYLRYRDNYIIEKCTGKNVLHLGATDWPFTEEKLEKGTLLYAKIDVVAHKQLGIDLDEKGVNRLNNMEWKNSSLVVKDFNDVADIDFEPDVIVFGETLEHLMNLKVALDSVKRIMKEETELIISVPNATNMLSFILAFFGHEAQHPDHKVAFTYKTITQLVHYAGFRVKELKMTCLIENYFKLSWKGKIAYAFILPLSRIFPLFSGNILLVATKNDE